MKKFQLSNVTSPSIQFEIGGHARSSAKIKNTKRNPNFKDSVLFFDVVCMPNIGFFIKEIRRCIVEKECYLVASQGLLISTTQL
jgi:hypothetical protein